LSLLLLLLVVALLLLLLLVLLLLTGVPLPCHGAAISRSLLHVLLALECLLPQHSTVRPSFLDHRVRGIRRQRQHDVEATIQER
jgi:hypothetical protein